MSRSKRISRLDGLTAEVVANAEVTAPVEPPTADTRDEMMRLSALDYGRALRSCMDRAEVREIVSEAKRKAWPHLNKDAVRLGSMREFAERASVLGADFRIAKMSWPTGLALLGFYLGTDAGLEKRALICVNGAHHRAAVGAAFVHEVGHHVTARLFSTRDLPVQLSRPSGYQGHLCDPRELAADVIVSLGLFPRETAMGLFGRFGRRAPIRESVAEQEPNLAGLTRTLAYTSRRYGLDLESQSTQLKTQYGAGLIHFTKLREALLNEYDL